MNVGTRVGSSCKEDASRKEGLLSESFLPCLCSSLGSSERMPNSSLKSAAVEDLFASGSRAFLRILDSLLPSAISRRTIGNWYLLCSRCLCKVFSSWKKVSIQRNPAPIPTCCAICWMHSLARLDMPEEMFIAASLRAQLSIWSLRPLIIPNPCSAILHALSTLVTGDSVNWMSYFTIPEHLWWQRRYYLPQSCSHFLQIGLTDFISYYSNTLMQEFLSLGLLSACAGRSVSLLVLVCGFFASESEWGSGPLSSSLMGSARLRFRFVLASFFVLSFCFGASLGGFGVEFGPRADSIFSLLAMNSPLHILSDDSVVAKNSVSSKARSSFGWEPTPVEWRRFLNWGPNLCTVLLSISCPYWTCRTW